MTPEQTLWQEVVIQAVIDALWAGNEFTPRGTYAPAATYRGQASAWIEGNSENYRFACEMAGFDPDFLREAFIAGRIDVDSLK